MYKPHFEPESHIEYPAHSNIHKYRPHKKKKMKKHPMHVHMCMYTPQRAVRM